MNVAIERSMTPGVRGRRSGEPKILRMVDSRGVFNRDGTKSDRSVSNRKACVSY